MITLDDEGYPTNEYLQYIQEYVPDNDFHDFLDELHESWAYNSYFILRRKYKGVQKLELHTGGWSGNESIINAILKNIYLTNFTMIYYKWQIGGHYYFKIRW